MRPKLLIPLSVIVLVPLLLLLWLGAEVSSHQQLVARHRLERLLTGRLSDVRATIESVVKQVEERLTRCARLSGPDASPLRELVRREPLVVQALAISGHGERLHPPLFGPLSRPEKEFLERTRQIWEDDPLLELCGAPVEEKASSRSTEAVVDGRGGDDRRIRSESASPPLAPEHSGWYLWHWGRHLHFIFWQRDQAGRVIGLELNRSRLLSEIIAVLPETGQRGRTTLDGRIALVGPAGETAYQWGAYDPPEGEPHRASLSLAKPLRSWNLQFYVPDAEYGQAGRGNAFFNHVTGTILVGLALAGLAVFLYREYSKEMREAAQRVSFVNQVSHELKTPLTNIRMYAELLEGRLSEDEDAKSSHYLGVIVSESQRLSRLIGNILTFGRGQRDKLKLLPAPGDVDEVIRSVLDQFRPVFQDKGLEAHASLNAGQTVSLDADALQQILANLLSNVEKYAASGKCVDIASEQEGETTTVSIADRGPGIPSEQQERVFEPFHRVSNRLSDGVTGTGIGLTISRDLARLHGGDLVLVPTEEGACFRITLHTPRASSEKGRG